MKNLFLLLLAMAFFSACTAEKELQVERCTFELQRIDTLYRAKGELYLYTWYDMKNKVKYSEYTEKTLVTKKYMVGMIRQ